MASNEDILKEADYYLNNRVTIKQASSDLKISERTLQLHLKKLESIAPDVFILVMDKKKANEKQGRIKGGTLGKRLPSWDMDTAKEVASKIITSELTYREAEEKLGIPKSTIHEMVHKVNEPVTDSLLYGIAEAHKKGVSVDEYLNERFSHIRQDERYSEIIEEENKKTSK